MMSNLPVLLLLMSVAPLLIAAKSNATLYFKSDGDHFSSQLLNVKLSYEPYEETWALFKKQYNRQYGSDGSDDEQYRRKVFMKNVKLIEQHNRKFFASQETYWMGINQFSDMTDDEFREYNKLNKPVKDLNSSADFQSCYSYVPPSKYVPASVDWRTKGYVTPVKNQGRCGSCWAFSTTGALEGQYYKAKGRLVSFSEQQLVDCSRGYGNDGCDGGLALRTYGYINSAGGIETEQSYPYEAADRTCRFSRSIAVATVSRCYRITQGSESDLKVAVATQGPVAVSLDATSSFQHYAGGIFSDWNCDTQTNHAVLAVGYGETPAGSQYWIIKNSWDTTWGDRGYVYMARNKSNMCGIATRGSFPVL